MEDGTADAGQTWMVLNETLLLGAHSQERWAELCLLSIDCMPAPTEVGRFYEEVGTFIFPFCRVEHGGRESSVPCLGC